jgi:very-short-patch-repair endonuclease
MTEWDDLTPDPSPSGERGALPGELRAEVEMRADSTQARQEVRVSWDFSVRSAYGRTRVNARVLRRNQTPQEGRLWRELRGRRIDGLKFRRQVPVGPFIVDFSCFEAGFIVEIDGSQHADPRVREYDEVRTRYLQEQGFGVLRITNTEIDTMLSSVLARIRTDALARTVASQQTPLSEREGAG